MNKNVPKHPPPPPVFFHPCSPSLLWCCAAPEAPPTGLRGAAPDGPSALRTLTLTQLSNMNEIKIAVLGSEGVGKSGRRYVEQIIERRRSQVVACDRLHLCVCLCVCSSHCPFPHQALYWRVRFLFR